MFSNPIFVFCRIQARPAYVGLKMCVGYSRVPFVREALVAADEALGKMAATMVERLKKF